MTKDMFFGTLTIVYIVAFVALGLNDLLAYLDNSEKFRPTFFKADFGIAIALGLGFLVRYMGAKKNPSAHEDIKTFWPICLGFCILFLVLRVTAYLISVDLLPDTLKIWFLYSVSFILLGLAILGSIYAFELAERAQKRLKTKTAKL